MQSSPLFIVGGPRSGTTFSCSLLNMHPLIELTKECRIFALLKNMVEVDSRRPDLLGVIHRDRLDAFGRRTLGAWVERYYHRDPRHVANSLLHKHWAASLEDGVRR